MAKTWEWKEVTCSDRSHLCMYEIISLGTETYLFTDDTKAFRCIFQHSGCEEQQKDIHALQEWSDKWLLCLTSTQKSVK